MVKIVVEDPLEGDIEVEKLINGNGIIIKIWDTADYYGLEITEIVLQKDITKAIRNHFYQEETKHV